MEVRFLQKAIMICVFCNSWKFPKHILVSTNEEYEKSIKDIAREAFEKYKATQQNKDIVLIDYSYYGDIELLTT